MIPACSSRTSCIISAEAGTTCSVAGCDAAGWWSWYWAMMTPPSTLTKVAGRTSTTSLPTNRLSKGASGLGAKVVGAKFVGAKFVGAKLFGETYFTSPVGWVAWCCMIPVPFDHPFFKRPVEFQTSVLGGRRPGKRIFCGNPVIFRSAAGSSPPAEAAGRPTADRLGKPFDTILVEHQPQRRGGQLLSVNQGNGALCRQPRRRPPPKPPVPPRGGTGPHVHRPAPHRGRPPPG